ncbi:hypothetical protein K461DRAFT_297847 [Myriangium duriaei CBS 260.36]|uniref:Uncharacterized protein n=1 Tax=Myriangium duriaei CBS 260.36 TaxID=1168546 RepID=A0A9P4IQY1_9PEZI|nr:hypothetical protein K461DRAFT_297847 [Myriangium duriaei CBS 260.36]
MKHFLIATAGLATVIAADCSAYNTAISNIRAHAGHPVYLCQQWLGTDRTKSPFPALTATTLVPSCECILTQSNNKIPNVGSKSAQAPSSSRPTCDSKHAATVSKEFLYSNAFCQYIYNSLQWQSPVFGLSVVQALIDDIVDENIDDHKSFNSYDIKKLFNHDESSNYHFDSNHNQNYNLKHEYQEYNKSEYNQNHNHNIETDHNNYYNQNYYCRHNDNDAKIDHNDQYRERCIDIHYHPNINISNHNHFAISDYCQSYNHHNNQ